jgi:hypothetical protein
MVLFVGINYLIWEAVTEDLLTMNNSVGGDLARMGYVRSFKFPRKNYDDLPLRHIEMEQFSGQKVDVLTIGDSFSNGHGGGRNRYYQDYLASLNGFTVLNIRPFKDRDSITSVSVLCNDGTLDRLKPRVVLIESSQKFCIEDFARKIDFNLGVIRENRDIYSLASDTDRLPAVSFINNGNFKYLLYNLLYLFSDHAFVGKACIRELKTSLFSVKNGDKLLFYTEDVKRIAYADSGSIGLMNRNLNTLAEKLASKGMKLYFMPCVDKYNLYSEFIKVNPYPNSTFFEELRKLPKKYNLIDTKAILAEELARGEMDIFYPDDSHWSWKASKKIFETVRFR